MWNLRVLPLIYFVSCGFLCICIYVIYLQWKKPAASQCPLLEGPWYGCPTICNFQWKIVEGQQCLYINEKRTVRECFSPQEEVLSYKPRPAPFCQFVLHEVSPDYTQCGCCAMVALFQPLQIVSFRWQSWNSSTAHAADHWDADTHAASTLLRHGSQARQCFLTLRPLACL